MKIWSLNGDCQVVQMNDGRVYVYDAAEPRIGRHTLVPFLSNHLGVKKIDGLIIGHYHWNHTGGVEFIIRYFERYGLGIDKVYSSGVYSNDRPVDFPIQDRIDQAIDKFGVTHEFVVYGDKIADDVWVMSPTQQAVNSASTDNNGRKTTTNANDQTGCAVKFIEGDFSCLLTSDLGPGGSQTGLRDMVNGDIYDVKSTVFQVPHHGDISYIDNVGDYDYEIINAIDPSVCLVGVRTGDDVKTELKPYLDSLDIDYSYLDECIRILVEGDSDGSYTIKTARDGEVVKHTSFSRGSTL